ncbi:hypothetical protein ACFLS9_08090, partial [Bacteroidota bacterium]
MSLKKLFMKIGVLTLFLTFLGMSTLNAKIIYVSATNGQTGANGSALSGTFPDVAVPTINEALTSLTVDCQDGDIIVIQSDTYSPNNTVPEVLNGNGSLVINKSVTLKAAWLTTNPTKLSVDIDANGILVDLGKTVSFESFDDNCWFQLKPSSDQGIGGLAVLGTLNFGTYNPSTSKMGGINVLTPVFHVILGDGAGSDFWLYFEDNSTITGNPPTLEDYYDIFLEWIGTGDVTTDQSTKIVNNGTAGDLGQGGMRLGKATGTGVTVNDPIIIQDFSDADTGPGGAGWGGDDGAGTNVNMTTGVGIQYGDVDTPPRNNNLTMTNNVTMNNNDIFDMSSGLGTWGTAAVKMPNINAGELLTFTGGGTNCADVDIGQLETSDGGTANVVVYSNATWTIDADGANWEACDLPIIRNGGTALFDFYGPVLVQPGAYSMPTICHVSNQRAGTMTFNNTFVSQMPIQVNFWNASWVNFQMLAEITGNFNNNFYNLTNPARKSTVVNSAVTAVANFFGMTTISGNFDNDGPAPPGTWDDADNIVNVEAPNGQLHIAGWFDTDADHVGVPNGPYGTGSSSVNYKSGPNTVGGNLDFGHVQAFVKLWPNILVTVTGKLQIGDGYGGGGTAEYGDGSVLELDGGIANHATWGGSVIMSPDPPPTGSNLGTGTILVSTIDAGCDGGNFPGLKVDSVTFNINTNDVDFRGPIEIASAVDLFVNAVANNHVTIGNNFDDPGDPAMLNLHTPGCTTFVNVYDDIITGFNPKFTLNGDGTFNTDPDTGDGTGTTVTVWDYEQNAGNSPPDGTVGAGIYLDQGEGCTFNVHGDFQRFNGPFVHDGAAGLTAASFNINGPHNQYFNPGSLLELYTLNMVKASTTFVITFGNSIRIGSVGNFVGSCFMSSNTRVNLDVHNIYMQNSSEIANNGIFDTGVPGAVISSEGTTNISGTGYYGNLTANGGDFMVGGWAMSGPPPFYPPTNVYFMDILQLFNGGVLVTGQDFGPYVFPPPPSGKDQLAVNALEAPGSAGDPRVVRYISDGTNPTVNNGTLEGNEIDLTGGGTWNFQNPYIYDLLITGAATTDTDAGPEMQGGIDTFPGYMDDIDLDFTHGAGTGDGPDYEIRNVPALGDTIYFKFHGVLDIKWMCDLRVNGSADPNETALASMGVGHTHLIAGDIWGDGVFYIWGTTLDGSVDETLLPTSKSASTNAIIPWGRLKNGLKVILDTPNDVLVKMFRYIEDMTVGPNSGNVDIENNEEIDKLTVEAGNVTLTNNSWIELLTVNGGNVMINMLKVIFGSTAKVATITADPNPMENFIVEVDLNGGTTGLGTHLWCEWFNNSGGIFNFNLFDVNLYENDAYYTRFESDGSTGTEFNATAPSFKAGTVNSVTPVPDTENNDIAEVVWNDDDEDIGNWWGTSGLLVPNAVVGQGVSVTLSSNAGVGGDTYLDIRYESSTLWINGYQLEIQGSSPAEWRTHDSYRNNTWQAGPSSGSDGRVLVSGSGVILKSFDTDFVLSTLKDYGIDFEVDMGTITGKAGSIMADPQFEITDLDAEDNWSDGAVKNPIINAPLNFPTDFQVWDFFMTNGDVQQHDNDITVGDDFMMGLDADNFLQDANGPKDYTGLDRHFGELVFASADHSIRNEKTDGGVPHMRMASPDVDLEIWPVPVSKVGETNGPAVYLPFTVLSRLVLGKNAGMVNTNGNLRVGQGGSSKYSNLNNGGPPYVERRKNNTGIGPITWMEPANVGIIVTDDVNDAFAVNQSFPNFNWCATANMTSTGEIPNSTTDPGVLQYLTIYLESMSGSALYDYNVVHPIQVNNTLEILGGELDAQGNGCTMASTVILDFHSDESTPFGPSIEDALLGGPIELIYRGEEGNLTTRMQEWNIDVNVLRVEMGCSTASDGDGTPDHVAGEHHTLTSHAHLTVQEEAFVQNLTTGSYFDLAGWNLTVLGSVPVAKSENINVASALTVDAPGGIANGDYDCDGTGNYFDLSTIYAPNAPVVGDGFILNCHLGASGARVFATDLSGFFGFSDAGQFPGTPWDYAPDNCKSCLEAWVEGPAVFGDFEGDFNGNGTLTVAGDFSCGGILAGGPVDIGGNFNGGDILPQGGCPLAGFTVHIGGGGPHSAGDIEACDGGGWNGCLEASTWHTVAGNVLGGSFGGMLHVETGHAFLNGDLLYGLFDIDNGNGLVGGYMNGTAEIHYGPFDPGTHVGPQVVGPSDPTGDNDAYCFYYPPDISVLMAQTTPPFNLVVGGLSGASFVYGTTYIMHDFTDCAIAYAMGHLIWNNAWTRWPCDYYYREPVKESESWFKFKDDLIVENEITGSGCSLDLCGYGPGPTINAWADVVHNDYCEHEVPDPCEVYCWEEESRGVAYNFFGWLKQSLTGFQTQFARSITINKRNQTGASSQYPDPNLPPNLGSLSLLPDPAGLVEINTPNTAPYVDYTGKEGGNQVNADFDERISPNGWTLMTQSLNLIDGIIATNNNVIQLPFNYVRGFTRNVAVDRYSHVAGYLNVILPQNMGVDQVPGPFILVRRREFPVGSLGDILRQQMDTYQLYYTNKEVNPTINMYSDDYPHYRPAAIQFTNDYPVLNTTCFWIRNVDRNPLVAYGSENLPLYAGTQFRQTNGSGDPLYIGNAPTYHWEIYSDPSLSGSQRLDLEFSGTRPFIPQDENTSSTLPEDAGDLAVDILGFSNHNDLRIIRSVKGEPIAPPFIFGGEKGGEVINDEFVPNDWHLQGTPEAYLGNNSFWLDLPQENDILVEVRVVGALTGQNGAIFPQGTIFTIGIPTSAPVFSIVDTVGGEDVLSAHTMNEGESQQYLVEANSQDVTQDVAITVVSAPDFVTQVAAPAKDPSADAQIEQITIQADPDFDDSSPTPYNIVLLATDTAGDTTSHTLALTVLNVNRPPAWVAGTPDTVQASVLTLFQYTFEGTDPDSNEAGHWLNYFLDDGPGTIVAGSGVYSWTPPVDSVGQVVMLILRVQDQGALNDICTV